jgi:type II secretory pathway component PulF
VDEPLGPITLVLLVIPASALRLAVRALYGRQRLAAADPMQMLLSMSSTILFVLAGLGLIVGLMGLWALMIPMPVVFVVLVLMTIDRMRHSEHRALVWALSAAAQKGVPLSEAARAYADETMGDTGVRALALAEAVERGEPLAQAVRTARLRMGTAMKLAVRLGERLGMLGPAMRQQLGASHQIDAALRDAIGRFFYLVGVAFILSGILTFMMLKIVPVFQRMFVEFGLELPSVTNLVINLSNWYEFGWVLFLPLWTILLPMFVSIGLLYYVGWLPRNLPLWWLLFRRYDGALVMRGLALAIRRNCPLPEALRLVADCYPLSIVAGCLRRAAERVEAGQNWCDSLLRTGLIGRADAAVLAAAERAGNLDWALEEMADSALRRQTYWIQALVQILFPPLVVALGSFVGLFAIGMFLPLVSLIEGLA